MLGTVNTDVEKAPTCPPGLSQPESSEEAPAVEEVEASAPQHLMGGSL